MRHLFRQCAFAGTSALLFACEDPAGPRPNVAVGISPQLVGSFSGLGGMHQLTAEVTDTLGERLDELPSWEVAPASSAITFRRMAS